MVGVRIHIYGGIFLLIALLRKFTESTFHTRLGMHNMCVSGQKPSEWNGLKRAFKNVCVLSFECKHD